MSRAATAQWQRSDSAATVATSAARQNKSFSEACSVCKQKANNKKKECYPETLKKQTTATLAAAATAAATATAMLADIVA